MGDTQEDSRIPQETSRFVSREVTRSNASDARCQLAANSNGPEAPPGDPLERALLLAAEAGRFDVVAQLAAELQARRLATSPTWWR